MRLLYRDSGGGFSLTKDLQASSIPQYAILSHTWGADNEELTFNDIVEGTGLAKAGYDKIRFCGERANLDGFQYFWVDTCCIDKSNLTELTEAINSMFRWYRNSAKCYVYLADVSYQRSKPNQLHWEPGFRKSRWFTRCWTLQELIAPMTVEFFSRGGEHLGNKTSMMQSIHEITGIPIEVLQGNPLSEFSVTERISWSHGRNSTREEDKAYSLLGIFNIYMPLIYGEGQGSAYRRLQEEINKTSKTQQEVPQRPSTLVPFCRDPDFISRGDILDQMERCYSNGPGRLALVGLGGVGKSQLAIEFAYRIADSASDTWVFWIHAGTRARVEEGFWAIADAIKLEGRDQPKVNIARLVYNWLSNERNGKWVIVIDSADDHEVFYSTDDSQDRQPLTIYLPQSRHGFILVTTRDKELASRLVDKSVIQVGAMTETDCLALLEKKLGSLPDKAAATNLVQVLDCVPLAISQATAFIQSRAPRSSVQKYLAEFQDGERKRAQLLENDAGDLRRDGAASNAVLTTWWTSFDYIRARRPSAADLLSVMSFFDPQGIPEWVLKPSTEPTRPKTGGAPRLSRHRGSQTDSSSSSSEIGANNGLEQGNAFSDSDSESTFSSGSSDTDANEGFEQDIAILRNYSLISANEEGNEFEMHRLVQLSTRRWLRASGQQRRFKQQCVKWLAAAFPTGEYENWETCRELFAHVQLAVGYRSSEHGIEDWASLCHKGGQYASSQGMYDISEYLLSQAMKARRKCLGEEDALTLASTVMYTEVVLERGRWHEAEQLSQKVMEIRKEKLGTDHPDTLTSMASLSLIYLYQGRWEEAEKLQVQVMETRKAKLGANHADTLTSTANLASTYWNQGRLERAKELEIQVMEARKAKLGSDHPDTLISMANLAVTYKHQGQFGKAKDLELLVMETCKEKLGVDHPTTLRSMANLAATYRHQGWLYAAERLETQVMETRKAKLEADHPSTLTSMANLATTYRHQGRFYEAERLEVQVMEMRRARLGADHPDTLIIMNNLALTWEGQGLHDKALALMHDCLGARQRVLGPSHPDTLSSLAAVEKWSQDVGQS